MAAPKGNRFWEARTTHGRDKIFASNETLWDACCEYFKWVEDNPLLESKSYQFQGVPFQDTVAKMRAMTISGLVTFLNIDRSTWTAWKTDKDFSATVTRVEDIIYDQKFSGAAADLLNASLIGRDLGLVDKREDNIKVQDANITITRKVISERD